MICGHLPGHGVQVDRPIGLQAPDARARVGPQTTDVRDEAQPTLAAVYDAHGRSAFSLAVAILGDQRAAESAVLKAFGVVRRAHAHSDETEGARRTRLLQHVYRIASAAEATRPASRLGARAEAFLAVPPVEREALLLCLHGASRAELASINRVSTGTIDAGLRRAPARIREADRVDDGESPAESPNPRPSPASPLARGRRS